MFSEKLGNSPLAGYLPERKKKKNFDHLVQWTKKELWQPTKILLILPELQWIEKIKGLGRKKAFL